MGRRNKRHWPKFSHILRDAELRKHVGGMKIINQDGYWHEFVVGGETHCISKFYMFAVSACVLGYLYAEKTNVDTVRLPVKIVLQIAELASSLEFYSKLKPSVAKMLKVADRLLTDAAIYSGAEIPKKSCVTFRLRGKSLEDFRRQLESSLSYPL